MRISFLISLVGAMSLSACAAPLVNVDPISNQSRADHLHDWREIARQTSREFKKSQHTSLPKIFVAPGPADMPFAGVFKSYLEETLMRDGFEVVHTAPGAMVLNFNVQSFVYGDDKRRHPVESATFWTTLYAIGTQIDDLTNDEAAVLAGVGGPLLDLLTHVNNPPNGEVLLTISIVSENRSYYLKNTSFYIRPSDMTFYLTDMPSQSGQPLVHEPLEVVRLPVLATR